MFVILSFLNCNPLKLFIHTIQSKVDTIFIRLVKFATNLIAGISTCNSSKSNCLANSIYCLYVWLEHYINIDYLHDVYCSNIMAQQTARPGADG